MMTTGNLRNKIQKERVCREYSARAAVMFRRDPKSLVKPSKKLINGEPDGSLEEEIKKKTPKASRHLLLIRHGQYNENGLSDDARMLTALGKLIVDSTL
jgi:hypothetical protein